jgi:hypothetical protein
VSSKPILPAEHSSINASWGTRGPAFTAEYTNRSLGYRFVLDGQILMIEGYLRLLPEGCAPRARSSFTAQAGICGHRCPAEARFAPPTSSAAAERLSYA